MTNEWDFVLLATSFSCSKDWKSDVLSGFSNKSLIEIRDLFDRYCIHQPFEG
jgi:hypothetical protein